MNLVKPLQRGQTHAPETFSVEPYVSADYARREADALWARVWQMACRVEELREVGDFVTYDILDQSIIVVRSAPDRLRAFYNVCMHRGRRLTASPKSERRKVISPMALPVERLQARLAASVCRRCALIQGD